ncbi:WG repeat-containing protein [Solitalea lacus]|uniref:WG repeat-containing protein n=1 Tax=Solitalea lacus TaxID=2911172 RepID=UPI001EDC1BD5|nr:WG repeat-containing protein [Solitalea lacus]UKJ08598.1 WG repeat-containing protein [Solitalea lacus]
MKKAFLQLNVTMRNKTIIVKYLFLLLSIAAISCTQKNKSVQTKPFEREKLKGYLNKAEDRWICEDSTYEADSFSDSLSQYASVMKMDSDRNPLGMGLINRQGEIMVPIIYDGLGVGFVDSLCQVNKADKLGLVNFEGKEIVAPTYEYISYAEDGLMRVGKNDLYGMINLKGEIVIPLMYKDARIANEGMIAVMIDPQKWGYINHKNEMIVKPEFTFIDKFENGKVILQKADGEDYIVYKDGRVEKKSNP